MLQGSVGVFFDWSKNQYLLKCWESTPKHKTSVFKSSFWFCEGYINNGTDRHDFCVCCFSLIIQEKGSIKLIYCWLVAFNQRFFLQQKHRTESLKSSNPKYESGQPKKNTTICFNRFVSNPFNGPGAHVWHAGKHCLSWSSKPWPDGSLLARPCRFFLKRREEEENQGRQQQQQH